MMKLSLIISTYNSASVLHKALDSIECHAFADRGVLVMDSVSTGNTLKVVQSYNDSRKRKQLYTSIQQNTLCLLPASYLNRTKAYILTIDSLYFYHNKWLK